MIWEPFVLALVLGLLVSAGLYFAYLWPEALPDEAAKGPRASGLGPPEDPPVPIAAESAPTPTDDDAPPPTLGPEPTT